MYRHKDKPYHIDYCFVSADMAGKLRSVEVGKHGFWTKYSDHVPVMINFEKANTQHTITKMDYTLYLKKFQKAADPLDKKMLDKKQMEVAVGIYKDSVFLKLYKTSWATPFQDPLTADSRIFFSVWVSDSIIKEQKMFYNIHALKLRQLKGYSIASRDFAESFRAKFKVVQHQWTNVSTKFGPQTLMEGWVKLDLKNIQHEILKLAIHFLEIDYLVDDTLEIFKK
jgi:hypothetical protein